MKEIINHIGDIFAIPFFILGASYFYNIENKNKLEYMLLFFNIAGALFDGTFTYLFLQDSTFKKIHPFAIRIIILISLLVVIYIYDKISN
jgi:hypothetical protein